MSRGLIFVGSRGQTASLRSPGRRSRRGMIVALVRNKYRGKK
ncbi:MAG TPA: hypothetical protein VGH23_05680 [Rhizomicrobium sp.]|jgi:hypothetical protein